MTNAARVLVIEDNLANQMLTAAVLQLAGFEVDLAGSSDDAIESVNSKPPALILMDVQLPGQNGLDLARQLKADPLTAAIPIVALTANAMRGHREMALGAGCDGYISKPIDTRTFAGQIREYMAGG